MKKTWVVGIAVVVVALLLAVRWVTQPPVPSQPAPLASREVVARTTDTTAEPLAGDLVTVPPPGPATPFERPAGRAVVTLGAREVEPQRFGTQFEQVGLQPGQEVTVTVSWPADDRSEDVLVHAIDGGRIDGGANAKRFSLLDSKSVGFTYRAGNGPGRYQVLLRRGTTEEVLRFWIATPHGRFDPPTLQ